MSDHAASHEPASHDNADVHHIDDVNVGNIVYWGFLSVVVTVLAIMLLHALYVWFTAEQVRAKSLEYDPVHALAVTRHAEQESRLEAAPYWYDEEKTMVAIPLERAIELTLEEYGQGRQTQGQQTQDQPSEGPPVRDEVASDEVASDEVASDEAAAPAPQTPPAAGEEAADTPADDEVDGPGADDEDQTTIE